MSGSGRVGWVGSAGSGEFNILGENPFGESVSEKQCRKSGHFSKGSLYMGVVSQFIFPKGSLYMGRGSAHFSKRVLIYGS